MFREQKIIEKVKGANCVLYPVCVGCVWKYCQLAPHVFKAFSRATIEIAAKSKLLEDMSGKVKI